MNNLNSNFIPKRLTQLRIMSHLTQKKLAKEVNISRSCLANYETGKRTPDVDMIKIFANYFDVSTNYFCHDEESASINNASESYIDIKLSVLKEDKLDMSHISPLSRLALVEFYNFLKKQQELSEIL